MPAEDTAANLIGIVVFVFASSTILLNQLLPRAEDELKEDEIGSYRRAAYFSVASGFLLTNFGVAVTSAGAAAPIGPGFQLISDEMGVLIGGILLVGAVSTPTVAAGVVATKLYLNER